LVASPVCLPVPRDGAGKMAQSSEDGETETAGEGKEMITINFQVQKSWWPCLYYTVSKDVNQGDRGIGKGLGEQLEKTYSAGISIQLIASSQYCAHVHDVDLLSHLESSTLEAHRGKGRLSFSVALSYGLIHATQTLDP